MPLPDISTPCVNICVVDPLSALCIGCGRSTAEIASWRDLSEPERVAIIGVLGARLAESRSRAKRGGRVRVRERGL
jgi:predicted Fe-S protein YdhL (DUF1289 family)